MPVDDDAAILFLVSRESPVMVRVQQGQDFLSGSFPVVTLKGLHVHTYGVSLAQARRELHFAVDEIVVLDEPPDETDDDYGGIVRVTVTGTDCARPAWA